MATEQQIFEFEPIKPIKGFPELHWTGKRPYITTQYFPAQLKERYGEEQAGWINRLYWGDNLQVMSHLLKEFRGRIDLIYIDPPFDDKADYKKKIEVLGQKAESDFTSFEEKQYGDIWTNDEYLQFMYERLILMRELLSVNGSIYLHCDWHKSHHLRMLMDEVFGNDKFVNEIVWCYEDIGSRTVNYFKRKHDCILMYGKSSQRIFNIIRKKLSKSTIKRYQSYFDKNGQITYLSLKNTNPGVFNKLKGIPEDLSAVWLDTNNGAPLSDWWMDISPLKNGFNESTEYPTQKPESLLERIIKASSDPDDIIFDCFMGSGTTQAVAMRLGRRFIGADINLGAIQIATRRLLKIKKELDSSLETESKHTGFEVYNVNNYDFFRNPLEAKDLLIEALEIQKFNNHPSYDGEKDGRMVKIMPVNRIASKADVSSFVAALPYKVFEKRKEENPNEPVEKFILVCMGHEPDLKAELQKELSKYKVDIEIVDILREKSILELKREAEADVRRNGNKLIVKKFYPMNLMQKLTLDQTTISDWKELVDSIMIDFNYAGAEMEPSIIDIPDKNSFVKGEYDIPNDAGRIKVKITDLLSESLEIILE